MFSELGTERFRLHYDQDFAKLLPSTYELSRNMTVYSDNQWHTRSLGLYMLLQESPEPVMEALNVFQSLVLRTPSR